MPMKFIAEKFIGERDIIPSWYGVSYFDPAYCRYVCHIIPLNLLMALYRKILFLCKFSLCGERLYTYDEARLLFKEQFEKKYPNLLKYPF